MNITPNMNLSDLAERMGSEATEGEALSMRIILTDSPYQTTEEVPEKVWGEMVDGAITGEHPSLPTAEAK